MKILVVDESEIVALHLAERLSVQPSTTTGSHYMEVVPELNYERARDTLADGNPYDVIIVEPYSYEQDLATGLDIIRNAKRGGAIPIVLTAAWRIERCVECMRAGAWDVQTKARPMSEIVNALVTSLLAGLGERDVEDKEAKWVSNNIEMLCRRYPGQWIAVVDAARNLFVNADTYDELIGKLDDGPRENAPKVWRLPIVWTEYEADF